MRRHTAIACAVAVTAIASSCTSEQSSTPAPTLTSTTSTTSTTTTTIAPPDTTEVPADTSAPTTEAETTTTLPSGPADALVSLVIGGEGTSGWLSLGAWQNDRWQQPVDDAGDPVRPAIAPSTAMTILTLDSPVAAQADSDAEACYDERVGPTLDATVAAPQPPGFGYGAVAATTNDWPFDPRPIAVTATGPESYRALGEAIFADDPVDASAGSVGQVVVGDLDGDGDDEAIVTFEFIQPTAGPGAPGDFSGLFLVDADSRTPTTIIEAAVPADLPVDAFPLTERFRVIAVGDVNGDGRMEVAVHAWYYEGASVLLYEYDGTTLTEVLSTGCGS